jgi:thymidylate synthase (FAD)
VIGIQSRDNKQGRDIGGNVSLVWARSQSEIIAEACRDSFAVYHELLAMDVPREVARTVLPLATYSHMFATVDLLNLLKFLTLRRDVGAQFEIRAYADAMLELVQPIIPVCIGAWLADHHEATTIRPSAA